MEGKQKIKNIIVIFCFLLFLCGAASCGKKQIEPNKPIQDLLTRYPMDNMMSFAARENGEVYGVNLINGDEPEYKLHRFNPQGEDEECITLENYFMVGTLVFSEDEEILYFTAENDTYGMELYLFAYSLEDGSITMLCEFPYFKSIKQATVVGDAIYLLGKSPNWQEKNPPVSGYSFAGERLVSYSLSTGEQTQLGFDFPISMAASGKGTLIVSGYLEGTGYCLMEYDPAKDSMQVIASMEEYKIDQFAVCNDGKDIIYDYMDNQRGLILSEMKNLEVEAEIFPAGSGVLTPVLYVGGKVYCKDIYTATLHSFPLEAVQRGNKTLSFITKEYQWEETPYGCGYRMERVELSNDKFTLKVLARDKDYDLCLANTLAGDGRNLRENGAFYPLNDVAGIDEYLARCFPYVREVATREDGTIWMLPVSVEVYCLLAEREVLEESGLSLKENMTWEEYGDLLQLASEEQREQIFLTKNMAKLCFCEQYFSHYRTLENDLFGESISALSKIWEFDCGTKATFGNILWQMLDWVYWMRPNGKEVPIGFGEDAVLVSLPKFAATDKNIASCTYLAVNPDSAKLEETLAYLTDLIAYLMDGGGMPYFTDWERENALDEKVYQVYENGEIAFGIDFDVYEEGLEEMLSGTLPLDEYIKKTESKLKIYWGE